MHSTNGQRPRWFRHLCAHSHRTQGLEKERCNRSLELAADLSAYFDSGEYVHANTIGEYAYLKVVDDEPRFTITDSGRRALRMAKLLDSG